MHFVVMSIAMLSILYGSTMAVKETHFKRRLAFSTVSNLAYILLGVTMMSPQGLLAGMAHLVFHAFMKIGAFFCAGAVLHQSGKTYVDELNGLAKKMPFVFTTFVVFGLSLIGIPPLPDLSANGILQRLPWSWEMNIPLPMEQWQYCCIRRL